MIKLDDPVYIIPSKSMKFASQWGRVVAVEPSNFLPILIVFTNGGIPYWFDYNEVVTKEQYDKIVDVPVNCVSCGTDITGQFTEICDTCEGRQFEEDMAAWQQLKR